MAVLMRSALLLILLYYLVSAVRANGAENLEDRFLALARRVEQLESRDALARRVEQLESRDRLQQAEIEVLKAELYGQKQRSVMLEKLVRKLKTRTPGANGPDTSSSSDNSVSGVEEHKGNTDLTRPAGPKTAPKFRRAANEQTVAFFAIKSATALHTGQNQNIVFESVVTNIGSAYSNTLGAFVAPVPGVYVFSMTLTAYGTDNEHYILSKNGHGVGSLYAHADASPHIVVGQTAVLHLSKGDNVEVRTADPDGSVHGGYSSFAGFLLQEEYGSPTVIGK